MILPGLWPWVVGGSLLGGAAISVGAGKLFYGGQIASLRADLAGERLATAKERSDALLELHSEAEKASADILGRIGRASEVLARESARIPQQDQKLTSLLLEVSGRDEFSCRRRALPESLLNGLRRPGDGETTGGGEGPGAGSAPGLVSHN